MELLGLCPVVSFGIRVSNRRWVIHRGNQAHKIGFIKLETGFIEKCHCFKLEVIHRVTWKDCWGTVVSCDSVCDLQFKTTAFFDETIVSSFMKPIPWIWFSLCMTQLMSSAATVLETVWVSEVINGFLSCTSLMGLVIFRPIVEKHSVCMDIQTFLQI
jgi:hypothetical protein